MKKHINLWLVMFLAISLVLPVYSMAQVTLTLEDPTGNRIVTPRIKSFAVGTDNNLVIYLDQPFNFKDLIPDISLASCTNCSIAGPAGVTATQGANLSFNVQSTDTSAVISLVASSYEIGPRTLTSTSGSAPFSWSTGSTPTGSYLAVFQALDGDQKSQLPVMINVVPPGYTLTVNAQGCAGSSVTKNPDQTTYSLSPAQTVALTPAPGAGCSFSAWSGDLTGSGNPGSILVNGNKSVTATFITTPANQYSLTVTINPLSAGTVALSPSGGSYTTGTQVTLTASPNSNYTFSSWQYVTTSNGTTATVTMPSTNTTVIANFMSSNPNPSPTPPPGAQLLALNVTNTLSFGAGTTTVYICPFVGDTITSASLVIFGKDSGTNLSFTWTFPDGTTSFSGGALGTDVGGITKVRSNKGFYPNYNHDYIPAGNHTLTINSIGYSTVMLTMSYN